MIWIYGGHLPQPRLICFVDSRESEFVSRALKGMRDHCDAAGWEIKVSELGSLLWDESMALLHDEAHSGENNAAAFVHFELTREQADYFRSAKVPLGYLGASLNGVESMADDSVEGGFLGAEYLADLGHKRIALICGNLNFPESKARAIGFKSALRAKDLSVEKELMQVADPALADEGEKAALELLKSPQRPTAIFCAAGDTVAEGVYAAAKSLGLKIPGDLSVLGYDDLPRASQLQPPLCTLSLPLEEMGKRLATRLLEAHGKHPAPKPGKSFVIPSLVRRQSCSPTGK